MTGLPSAIDSITERGQRIGVHAGDDGHVEVGHEGPHVGAEAEQVHAIGDPELRRERRGTPRRGRRRKSSGVSPTTTKATRARSVAPRRSRAQLRAAHHLDVPLAAQHTPVAPEDDDLRTEPELARAAFRAPSRRRSRSTSSPLWMTLTLSGQCGKSAAAARETHTMRRTPSARAQSAVNALDEARQGRVAHVPERGHVASVRARAPPAKFAFVPLQ